MQLNRRNLLKMAPVALVPTVAVAAPIVAHAEPVKDMSVLVDYFRQTWKMPLGMKGEIKSIDMESAPNGIKLDVCVSVVRYDKTRSDLHMYFSGPLNLMTEQQFRRMCVWFIIQSDADIIGIHPAARMRFATAIEDSVSDGSFRYDEAIKLYTGLPDHPSKDLYSPEFMNKAIFYDKPNWATEA